MSVRWSISVSVRPFFASVVFAAKLFSLVVLGFHLEFRLPLLSVDLASCGLVETRLRIYNSLPMFSRTRSSWFFNSSKSFSSLVGSSDALASMC